MENKDDKTKKEEKELKRLLEAHVLVLKNKHGRSPTLDEVQSALGDKSESSPTPVASATPNPGSPKQEVKSPEGTTINEGLQKAPDDADGPNILHMKVYYGMSGKDGEKKPDPKKVLFYENPKDSRFYSVEDQDWVDGRPSVIDHLNSRSIQHNDADIVSAIANGVMGDSDYESLDKCGMLSETPKRLWQLTKRLKAEVSSLESMEKSTEPEVDENVVDPDLLPEGNAEPDADVLDEDFADAEDVTGDDVFTQIVEAAKSAAMTGMEGMIRQIVQQELAIMLGEDPTSDTEDTIENELPLDDDDEVDSTGA